MTEIKCKVWVSWSSGKDSAWALYRLQQEKEWDVVGLVSIINEKYQRVSMHATRVELVKLQAESIGLPLRVVTIPDKCDNNTYNLIMRQVLTQAKEEGVYHMAFGDLFLEDVRIYREKLLEEAEMIPLFPLWHIATDELAKEMIIQGLEAYVTCVDPRVLSPSFAGRRYDTSFLSDLPANVDPCGEKGEFHTFVINGPLFQQPLPIKVGEVVAREGFVFADICLS
jgi:uncharacterized protein (TIGR00290 family)